MMDARLCGAVPRVGIPLPLLEALAFEGHLFEALQALRALHRPNTQRLLPLFAHGSRAVCAVCPCSFVVDEAGPASMVCAPRADAPCVDVLRARALRDCALRAARTLRSRNHS